MIVLAMIVRNEAEENLVRCLDSVKGFADSVFLIDTGSTDGTQALARKWGRENKVPLLLLEEPWENFQVNRTSLIQQAAMEADWILMLDADMVLHTPDPMPDLNRVDCWQGRVGFAGVDYTLPFLIRSGKPWRYEGVAHSYLACGEEFDEAEMGGLWVDDYSHTSHEKLLRDLEALSVEHARNPLHPRTTFYLAQTYFDLDMHAEAIQFYRSRAYMSNGWDEETYYAAYRLGCLLCEHVSYGDGARELLRAWEMRPSRAEALRALAGSTSSVADKLPKPTDRLFVHPSAYTKRQVTIDNVSAVIVTRGNVDITPTLDQLPYKDVVVWDNSKKRKDMKILGRYEALKKTKNDIVFFVDDDVVFTEHEALLSHYEPGKITANMDPDWVKACGYDDLVMLGAGSVADKNLFWPALNRYLEYYPRDDEFMIEVDFIVGTIVPGKKVDLGYYPREFTDDDDRLYRQPWQPAMKEKVRAQARIVRDAA